MSFDFAGSVWAAERQLLERLPLVAAPIPADLAHAEGTLRGSPVTIDTRAWCGPAGSPIAWARFVSMRGAGVDVANVVCLSAASFPLPIFGADLVALSPRAAMMAADLSPTLPASSSLREAQLAELAALRAAHPALPAGGELPAYCADFFSPHHVYARYGVEQRDAARSVFAGMFTAYVALAATVVEDAAHAHGVEAVQRAYARAHVSDEKGLEVLARAFGRPWAIRYIHEVMFPMPKDTFLS